MLVALLTAVVLYFSIQLLQKDRDATDFGTVFIIVFVPALILFISNVTTLNKTGMTWSTKIDQPS